MHFNLNNRNINGSTSVLLSNPVTPFARRQSLVKNQNLDLNDWSNTPVYRTQTEGETDLEAILYCIPDYQILRLAALSRRSEEEYEVQTPVSHKSSPAPKFLGLIDRENLETTLRKEADLTELEYYTSLLKKRDDDPLNELIYLHDKGSLTLMTLLVKIGRLQHFDSIMQQYKRNLSDRAELKMSVLDLFERCMKTHGLIEVLRTIFKNFKKHRTLFIRLNEVGLEQKTEGFPSIK